MSPESVLHLLVLECSLEDAEHLLSTLRNGGIATRPSTAEDLDGLAAVLDKKRLDLVLLNTANETFTVAAVAEAVMRSGKDLPIIAVLDEFTVENLMAAMQQGAVNAVDCENSDHILGICKQVQSHVESRRKLRLVEASLRETERRCHALLDSSRDAIAYVHEGMHVYANPAYLDLFGHDEFEDLASVPILDIVVSGDAGALSVRANLPKIISTLALNCPTTAAKKRPWSFPRLRSTANPAPRWCCAINRWIRNWNRN